MMVHSVFCKIIKNRKVGESCYYFISVSSKEISDESKPGQFVMLGLKNSPDIFLPRPYTICGTSKTFEKSPKDSFQLLYKVVGKGTLALSKAKRGEEVSILGPLGNPFSIEDVKKRENVEHIIIAGGIGSAPFPLLIHSLNRLRIKPVMLYGGRNKIDLPLKHWFKQHCARLFITTEDGSAGTKGMITDILDTYCPGRGRSIVMYACGPQGMLKKVEEISSDRGYPAYGSFEERMACGFGVCLGCAIPAKAGRGQTSYKHVCKDGPVFDMAEIDFHKT